MDTFLEQFYERLAGPAAAGAPGEENRRLRREAEERYKALARQLGEADALALDELLDAERQAAAGMESEAFREGFRLGARMMLEVCRPDEGD